MAYVSSRRLIYVGYPKRPKLKIYIIRSMMNDISEPLSANQSHAIEALIDIL